jgi:UDP-N-acetylglucosamine 2-epimerase (non-hydrolysing)
LDPSPDGDENLLREGVPAEKIECVGNIMIDSLDMLREAIEKNGIYLDLGLVKSGYGVVTLHRPSNVDNPKTLKSLVKILKKIAIRIPIIYVIHPFTV